MGVVLRVMHSVHSVNSVPHGQWVLLFCVQRFLFHRVKALHVRFTLKIRSNVRCAVGIKDNKTVQKSTRVVRKWDVGPTLWHTNTTCTPQVHDSSDSRIDVDALRVHPRRPGGEPQGRAVPKFDRVGQAQGSCPPCPEKCHRGTQLPPGASRPMILPSHLGDTWACHLDVGH